MIGYIYPSKIWHKRHLPRSHSFRYRTIHLGLPLDALESYAQNGGVVFGRNRRAILSIWDEDYFEPTNQPIMEKLDRFLKSKMSARASEEVFLITMPRFLGYVFNPVNFYILVNAAGEVSRMVCEVSNTFGERHLYLLNQETQDGAASWKFEKSFYVSPFFDLTGQYRVALSSFGARLSLGINLLQNDTIVFSSVMVADGRSWSRSHLLTCLCRLPFALFLTMIRIEWQALKLYFSKGLSPISKPLPSSLDTIRSHQNWWHRVTLALVNFASRRRRAVFPRQRGI